MRISSIAISVLAPSLLSVAAFAGEDGSRLEKFEEAVERYCDLGWFSGTVLVAEKGESLFEASCGMADAEHGVANGRETKFRIGSITKQFTAAAILLLQEEGKLAVTDTVGKHVPDYPAVGAEITIHQLLTHTAGLPDYTGFDDFSESVTCETTVEELVARFKDRKLDFEPGTKWSYSNSGYALLGLIIEKASGQKYEDFVEEHIFARAGLESTLIDRPLPIIPHRARGYMLWDGDEVRNTYYIHPSVAHAAGAALSTTGDLLRWDRLLKGSEILSDASREALFKPQFLIAEGMHYGYGWVVDSAFGQRRLHHNGGINGFITNMVRYPDVDVTIVALGNREHQAPITLSDKLGAIVFEKPYSLPEVRRAVDVSEDEVAAILGDYQINEALRLMITEEDGKVFARVTKQRRARILAESNQKWFWKMQDVQVSFRTGADGAVVEAIIHQDGVGTVARRLADGEGSLSSEPTPRGLTPSFPEGIL